MALKAVAGNSSDACFVSERIMNDHREDVKEENLSQVGNHIEILKNTALDFGDKIDDHIEKTVNINDKVQLLLLNDKMEFREYL